MPFSCYFSDKINSIKQFIMCWMKKTMATGQAVELLGVKINVKKMVIDRRLQLCAIPMQFKVNDVAKTSVEAMYPFKLSTYQLT